MHNKKILANGLILGAVISTTSINSMATYNNEYDLLNINNNLNSLNNNKIKKENKVENLINEVKIERMINSKETIKVNKNIVEDLVLEISLADGEFVPNLAGNPDGYETVKVTTTGNKKLVATDYNNLRLSGIPKVDLSNASSDSIPAGAFTNATHLIEFKFPQGITSIGGVRFADGAFYGCRGLTGDLVIPEGVISIGSYAFYGCSGLTGDLVIPDSVTSIGSDAFSRCSGFDGSLVIPDSVTSIGSDAFSRCSGFTGDLVIPDSVTSIGSDAFHGCSGFNGSLVISEGVISIESYTFYGCSGLTGDLVIPEGVTSIGSSAFNGCRGFNGSLVISASVTSIGNSAFYGCSGLIGNLVIPGSVTSIGDSAFRGCSGLVGNLVIPDLVTSIGNYAFYGCSGLTGDLVIPDSVTSIGNYAFYGCSGLTGDLVIPEGVISIGNVAFFGCSGFNGNLVIPGSVTSIGDSAFRGCSGLIGNLVIPDSVTSIGNYAFYGCSGLTGDLVIGNSVESIGNSAFEGCSNIEKILIKVDSSAISTNYKENIIRSLPDTSQTVIDIPYDFDVTGTWLENTNKTVGKPVIKNITDEVESDLIDLKGEKVSLYIPSLYQESNVTVLKDGKSYTLPTKDVNNKHIFKEAGVYQITVTTDLGNTSVINFEVEDPQFKIAEEAVENAEQSKESVDIKTARDLVNQLPECSIKDQLQNRLDEIFPNLTLERETATANVDVYIKSENMLRMSLDTNIVSFEDYSGVEPMEKLNAVNITINSSLPYTLNAYLPNEISNADGSNKMDIDILNIKESSENEYKQFENTVNKLVLKDSCPKGNGSIHKIDLKLDSSDAHKADIYKTVIKFEAEQK